MEAYQSACQEPFTAEKHDFDMLYDSVFWIDLIILFRCSLIFYVIMVPPKE